MSDFPFLSRLKDRLETSTIVERDEGELSDRKKTTMPAMPAVTFLDGPVPNLFEAAVCGVQSRLPHLSVHDIAYPPHGLFDAQLARQIALHLLVRRLGAPKQRVSRELARSREAVNRALKIVDERMAKPEFADAYEAMAEHALTATYNQQDSK